MLTDNYNSHAKQYNYMLLHKINVGIIVGHDNESKDRAKMVYHREEGVGLSI
ncbi:hypothetical protein PITCH_A1340005 [uncultured Desulfobacterium sp.]|uniref:Uncharacterized protein n=1 Tax=uncultured Desulfobacterium sp. TaxID=201089 RepID=A0A445MSL5_9BACT|nr:hypothetical protein PITCH_A1340005 [uncultured Desulfobacterium sp.]